MGIYDFLIKYNLTYKPLYKDKKATCCDFCGCEIHDNEYDNDGVTIMCKTCQESGKFGHYNTK